MAWRLGIPTADELLDRLTPDEWSEARAVLIVDPDQPERQALLCGLLAAISESLHIRAWGGEQAIDPLAFLIDYAADPEAPEEHAPTDEDLAWAQQLQLEQMERALKSQSAGELP